MNWDTEDGSVKVASGSELARLVEKLERGHSSFAILSRGGTTYMQVAALGDGYVIEKRSGSADTHVHARRAGRHPAPRREQTGFLRRLLGGGSGRPAPDTFRLDEVKAAFLAYYEGQPDPAFLDWDAGPV